MGEGVCEGILRLALAGRLSAISCMSVSPRWARDAPRLEAVAERCEIGLHLTLTGFPPLGAMPRLAPDGVLPTLDRLVTRLGAASVPEIAQELQRQLDVFEIERGRAPDFLDGHQHVHLLPKVRDAVLALFASGRLDAGATWVRNCYEPPAAVLRRGVSVPKTLFLSALARPMQRRAQQAGLRGNDSFRGVTGFDVGSPVRPAFQRFLTGGGARPLSMCHPGLPDAVPHDAIAGRRPEEMAYLSGPAFLEDLEAAGVRLARFGEADALAR